MKKWGVIIFLLCAFQLRAQTITCIAGNGTGGDGTLAISASVNDPNYTTFDSYGNLYFSEPLDNKIKK